MSINRTPVTNPAEFGISTLPSGLIDARRVNNVRESVRLRALNTLEQLYEAAAGGDVRAFRSLQDIQQGDIRLYETQTTSDFAALTSELMGRRLKARFLQRQPIWSSYVPRRQTPITDFKNVYNVQVDRKDNSVKFNTPIGEGEAFGYSTFQDSIEGYKVAKYIEGYKHTFELMMNDDLGGLAQIVPYMVDDQIYVQEYFAASLHSDANGPDATLYTGARGNIVNDGVTPNMPLTEAALVQAFAQIEQAEDKSGRPIVLNNGYIVVVANPVLKDVALRYKNLIETRNTEGTREIVSRNTLADFDVIYNPYIKSIVTTNLATSWWVFPRPVDGDIRTWGEMGFMRGFEVPQTYMKSPNTMMLNGAMASEIGDFNTWTREYAVATIFGGRQLENYQVTVASNGTGV